MASCDVASNTWQALERGGEVGARVECGDISREHRGAGGGAVQVDSVKNCVESTHGFSA